jgi:hypothetical protein
MMGREDARNMWSFVTKENFGYLMHLVGYLYEDYHDARLLEHKASLHVTLLRTLVIIHCRHDHIHTTVCTLHHMMGENCRNM